MKLRDQIASVLADKGPLNIIELSIELQRRAGISQLTNSDLLCGKKGRANMMSSVASDQRIRETIRQRLADRFSLLTDLGYTLHGLHHLLSTSSQFEPVDVSVSASSCRKNVPMRCWRNKE